MRAIPSISASFAIFLLLAVGVPTAAAQDPGSPDAVEAMAYRFGPLGLNPTLSVTNLGVDSNIFNEAGDPQSDFTMTVTPRLQARLRAQRALVSGSVATGFVYFQKFDEERSIDYTSDGRFELDLDWFHPYISASLADTRERLNAELDERAPRRQTLVEGGAQMLTSSRTAVVLGVRRTTIDFENGVFFEGVPLSQTMNSSTESIEGGLQVFLTPLTTLDLTAGRETDRFDHAPERASNTIRVMSSLRMEAPAIVQGSVAVGYRHFDTLDAHIPDYSGVVVHGSLTHVVAERTKFDLLLTRDVQYSFEETQPYYVSTGLRLVVTHQLFESFDVRGTGGRERLDYRDESTLPVAGAGDSGSRLDRVDLLGAGAGYRLRPNLRVGFDLEYAKRHSDRADRRYDRTRAFASITYGL